MPLYVEHSLLADRFAQWPRIPLMQPENVWASPSVASRELDRGRAGRGSGSESDFGLNFCAVSDK
jgi:hypothetical protein